MNNVKSVIGRTGLGNVKARGHERFGNGAAH